MTYYDDVTLQNLNSTYHKIPNIAYELLNAFLIRSYVSERAKEFAHHGISRRITTLRYCIQSIFDKIPPEGNCIPSRAALAEATIALQAYIFNTFGLMDNLAHT